MDEPTDRNVSVQILRTRTKDMISSLLNPELVLKSESNNFRHWAGLAALCRIKPTMEARIAQSKDPTNETLELWSEQDPEGSTIRQLLLHLEEMDRFDVIDDLIDIIDEDIQIYLNNPVPLLPPSLENDKTILTRDDVNKVIAGQPLEIYNAFVLYDQEDIVFATRLIDEMEKSQGMKLCIKDRDLVVGSLEYEQMIQLITKRCNRIIVILSDAFFKSSANTYYMSFAQAYGVAERHRKIIPVLYKECKVTDNIRVLSVLDYRKMVFFDFWGRLKSSLIVANSETPNRSQVQNIHELPSRVASSAQVRPPLQVTFSNNVKERNCDTNKITCPPLLTPTTSVESENLNIKSVVWYKKILKQSTKTDEKEKKKGLFSSKSKRSSEAIVTEKKIDTNNVPVPLLPSNTSSETENLNKKTVWYKKILKQSTEKDERGRKKEFFSNKTKRKAIAISS